MSWTSHKRQHGDELVPKSKRWYLHIVDECHYMWNSQGISNPVLFIKKLVPLPPEQKKGSRSDQGPKDGLAILGVHVTRFYDTAREPDGVIRNPTQEVKSAPWLFMIAPMDTKVWCIARIFVCECPTTMSKTNGTLWSAAAVVVLLLAITINIVTTLKSMGINWKSSRQYSKTINYAVLFSDIFLLTEPRLNTQAIRNSTFLRP